MTSNFEHSPQSLTHSPCLQASEADKSEGVEEKRINEDFSKIPRKMPDKIDLLYKYQQLEMNKTGNQLGSLGKYFGWHAQECDKVKKELWKSYQRDFKYNQFGVLSNEESQASTPNQCKKVEISKKFESKLKEKGKNCKKKQDGLKKLLTSQSFSPETGEFCTKEKPQMSPKPSALKKPSDHPSCLKLTKNFKEFQRNCQKIKTTSNQSNETRVFEPYSTVSLFQKSFSDFSKVKHHPTSLASNNPLQSPKSVQSEKRPESQELLGVSPKSAKKAKKDLDFFSSSPKPSSSCLHHEKITSCFSSSPNPLKLKKVLRKDSLKLSPRSEKVLIEKMTREFNSLLPEDSHSSSTITYSSYLNILKGLHLTLESSKGQDDEKTLAVQLWETLSTDSKLEKSKLLSSVFAILRFKPKNSSLSPQDSENLHKKFKLFYLNRLSFFSTAKSPPKPVEFSFHPKINENSKLLMSSMSSESSRAEKRCEKILPSLKTLKSEAEKKKTEDLECTFRPKVNNYLVRKSETFGQSLSDEYQKIINKNIQRTQALFELASVVQEKRKKIQKQEKSAEKLDSKFFQCDDPAGQAKTQIFACNNDDQELQGLDRTFHVSLSHGESEKQWKDFKTSEELPGDGWDGLKTKEIRIDPKLVESLREGDCEKSEKLKKNDVFDKPSKEKTTLVDKNGKAKDLQLALANSKEETSLDQL